jgi:uncharacterized membrane protein YcgQ (UPF0703/DUF1980 family)
MITQGPIKESQGAFHVTTARAVAVRCVACRSVSLNYLQTQAQASKNDWCEVEGALYKESSLTPFGPT